MNINVNYNNVKLKCRIGGPGMGPPKEFPSPENTSKNKAP